MEKKSANVVFSKMIKKIVNLFILWCFNYCSKSTNPREKCISIKAIDLDLNKKQNNSYIFITHIKSNNVIVSVRLFVCYCSDRN